MSRARLTSVIYRILRSCASGWSQDIMSMHLRARSSCHASLFTDVLPVFHFLWWDRTQKLGVFFFFCYCYSIRRFWRRTYLPLVGELALEMLCCFVILFCVISPVSHESHHPLSLSSIHSDHVCLPCNYKDLNWFLSLFCSCILRSVRLISPLGY